MCLQACVQRCASLCTYARRAYNSTWHDWTLAHFKECKFTHGTIFCTVFWSSRSKVNFKAPNGPLLLDLYMTNLFRKATLVAAFGYKPVSRRIPPRVSDIASYNSLTCTLYARCRARGDTDHNIVGEPPQDITHLASQYSWQLAALKVVEPHEWYIRIYAVLSHRVTGRNGSGWGTTLTM